MSASEPNDRRGYSGVMPNAEHPYRRTHVIVSRSEPRRGPDGWLQIKEPDDAGMATAPFAPRGVPPELQALASREAVRAVMGRDVAPGDIPVALAKDVAVAYAQRIIDMTAAASGEGGAPVPVPGAEPSAAAASVAARPELFAGSPRPAGPADARRSAGIDVAFHLPTEAGALTVRASYADVAVQRGADGSPVAVYLCSDPTDSAPAFDFAAVPGPFAVELDAGVVSVTWSALRCRLAGYDVSVLLAVGG